MERAEQQRERRIAAEHKQEMSKLSHGVAYGVLLLFGLCLSVYLLQRRLDCFHQFLVVIL